MARCAPETLGMTFDWEAHSDAAPFRAALRYWQEKRGGRVMPRRADVVPSELRGILPLVQLYDVLDRGSSYRVRLLGTQVAKMFETDPTGRTFDRTTDHPLISRMLCVIESVVERRRPLIARASRTAIDKVNYASIESLYLPLSEDDNDVNMVLTVTLLGGISDDEQPTQKLAI
jgi:hypothetical protein